MKLIIEIRPGEGGEDARLLTKKQAAIYQAYAAQNSLAVKASDSVG